MKKIYKLTSMATLIGCLSSQTVSAQIVSFATPPQGSVWNTMSNSIANLSRSKTNFNSIVQPYSGNKAMMDAIDQKQSEFAINDVNDVIVAYKGEADYRDKARKSLRVVMRISPQPIGIFVKSDSGIDSISDLKNKRVAAGWNAFPLGRSHMTAMMSTSGVTWSDVDQVLVPDLIRAADALASGRLDATFFAVGGPKVAEVNASLGGVKFLPVDNSSEALQAMTSVRPAFYFSEVKPAKHIAGLSEPMNMVTWDNVLVTGSHVPEEVVYEMVKTVLGNKEELVKLFPGFKGMNLNAPAPTYPDVVYHPGAARYFREHGYWK